MVCRQLTLRHLGNNVLQLERMRRHANADRRGRGAQPSRVLNRELNSSQNGYSGGHGKEIVLRAFRIERFRNRQLRACHRAPLLGEATANSLEPARKKRNLFTLFARIR
jgi:hypothetical protein